MTESEFEYLVDLVCCRYGAAIGIGKAHTYLGLQVENGPVDTLDFDWVKSNLPVEICYPDPKKGFHSALVIDTTRDKVILINSTWKKKKWSDIRFYPHLYNRKLRSFKLT